jgi:3-hydroxybutyrate dehydrogenase
MNIVIKPASSSRKISTAEEALAGKVSLLTGSTCGIGLGIARALAAAVQLSP